MRDDDGEGRWEGVGVGGGMDNMGRGRAVGRFPPNGRTNGWTVPTDGQSDDRTDGDPNQKINETKTLQAIRRTGDATRTAN